jgi:hypothetical protein
LRFWSYKRGDIPININKVKIGNPNQTTSSKKGGEKKYELNLIINDFDDIINFYHKEKTKIK